MVNSTSPLSSETKSPERSRPVRSTRNANPRHTKSQILDWKKKETPILVAPRIPEQPPQSAQPERQQKRSRPFSLSTSPLSPQPPEDPGQAPKTANRPTPRHSLPKAKPVTKKPRPSTGNTRSQPTRGDTQPSTARATPAPTSNDLPTKVVRTREDLPSKQLARPMDQTPTLDVEIRNEATMLVAQAEERRQMLADAVPDLSSPNNDDLTPASSTRLIRPVSPSRTGQRTPRIRTLADDDDLDPYDDFDAAFDADFEKVKEAYTRGIRPCNNPLAPQEHSVPIYGLEDASPPDWSDDQPPTVVTAPRRDRVLPDDPVQRGHRLGLDGMTHDISVDSVGYITNIKVCLLLYEQSIADWSSIIYRTFSTTTFQNQESGRMLSSKTSDVVLQFSAKG